MKIVLFDCFSGISGDMTLGALADCGVPQEFLIQEIAKLGLSAYDIKFSEQIKNHIQATKINIEFNPAKQPDRKYTSIVDLIEKSGLSDKIKKKSIEAFTILGNAEAKIHGKALEDIHFHEVGAVDSIVDLVGSIIGIDYLKVAKVYSAPVPLGSGFTKTDHGTMPVPSPAAIEILKDYPVVHRTVPIELTTPTGATIIKVLSDGIMPENMSYIPEKIGFGAGSKEIKEWPNLLRIIVANTTDESRDEFVTLIEANIDDLNPEMYPYITELLLNAGAKDVFLTSIIMKKGRPGTKVSVLATDETVSEMEKILFNDTTTIGVRKIRMERKVLKRDFEIVETKFGKIKVKKVFNEGKIIYRPEYEECRILAEKLKVNLQDIYREVDLLNK